VLLNQQNLIKKSVTNNSNERLGRIGEKQVVLSPYSSISKTREQPKTTYDSIPKNKPQTEMPKVNTYGVIEIDKLDKQDRISSKAYGEFPSPTPTSNYQSIPKSNGPPPKEEKANTSLYNAIPKNNETPPKEEKPNASLYNAIPKNNETPPKEEKSNASLYNAIPKNNGPPPKEEKSTASNYQSIPKNNGPPPKEEKKKSLFSSQSSTKDEKKDYLLLNLQHRKKNYLLLNLQHQKKNYLLLNLNNQKKKKEDR